MTTTTEHLKRLAEAATPAYERMQKRARAVGDEGRLYAFGQAANPATIKAICELVEQMGEALKGHVYYTRPIHQSTEALAAYEAFQKGEGK